MSSPNESFRRKAEGPRVGIAQIAPALGDTAANLERHRQAVARAAEDGCDLLVFPELSLTGYRLKDSVPEVALARDGEAWRELEALSKDVSIVAGIVEESRDHLFFNSAVLMEEGRTVAVHRKAYLPTYGMFDEQRYFARGRRVQAFDSKQGRAAILICEDMLHPSALTVAVCDGATLVLVPSASPARGVVGTTEADANARSWEAYNRVMARTFGVWVVYANRVGVEDGVTFWGGSELVSPSGETVVKAAYYEEDFVSAVLAADAVRRRRVANPAVRDEDLDLTINELSRIRGRSAEGAGRPRRFEDRPPRGAGERFSRDRRTPPPWRDRGEGAGDADAPPRRRFGDDEGSEAPRRGRFGGPRRDDDAPRGRFGGGGFGGPRRDDDAPRGRFGGGGFGGPRRDGDAPRGRFGGGGFGGPRRDDDAPRGRFGGGPRRDDGPPRGRFGGGGFGGPRRDDDAPRGRFGGGPRRDDGPPRGRFGGGPRRDDGPPRGRFGGGPRRDDGPGARFAAKKGRVRAKPEKSGKGRSGPRREDD